MIMTPLYASMILLLADNDWDDFDEETILSWKHFPIKASLQFQFLIVLFIGNFIALHCKGEEGIALQETCLESKLPPKSFIKNSLLLLHNGTNSFFEGGGGTAESEDFIETQSPHGRIPLMILLLKVKTLIIVWAPISPKNHRWITIKHNSLNFNSNKIFW